MKLRSLHLHNFKNYKNLDLSFEDDSPILILGRNGQGKTNFLESIAILALSKSFHALSLKEMVRHEVASDNTEAFFRIRCEIESHSERSSLEVFCGRLNQYPKTLKINDLPMRAKDYIGHLRVVIFTPYDLNLIYFTPQTRRRYIDLFISQIDKLYLEHLISYRVHLKQRNRLLMTNRGLVVPEDQLVYWDQQLAEHAGYILWKRREIFSYINHILSNTYSNITGESIDLRTIWKQKWIYHDPNQLRDAFRQALLDNRSIDHDRRTTSIGPHREDFRFIMNDRDIASFASRGECRSAILALKIAEISLIRDITGDTPVILMDDVLSELDSGRQKNLLEIFYEKQVFITATHLDFEMSRGRIYTVSEGNILPSN